MRLFKNFKIHKSEFMKGSLILLVSINIFNILNYFFHFISARFLGPINYGVLATIMSILYIFGIPSESIQMITSRYSTKFNIKGDKGRIKNLMSKSIKKFLILGIFSALLFIIFSPLIGRFLFIEEKILMLAGVVLIGLFLVPITRGILQGTKKFKSLGLNYILDGSIKLVLTIFLILIGWKVYGAIVAIILSLSFAFLFSFLSLKEILKEKKKEEEIKGIYSYSFPVLVSIASIMILLSIDIILAKRFFSAEIAGQYAVISMLSKIIFFATWPISKAMFPLTSEKHDKKEDSKNLLKKSFQIVLFIALLILLIYFLIPKSIIRILYGIQYLKMAPLLVYPSIALAILSLTNIIVFHNLSSDKKNINYVILFFVILQIILLSLFHSTLMEFARMLILNNALLFIAIAVLSLKSNFLKKRDEKGNKK